MPGSAAVSRPVITQTAAELFVADIKASCAFFTEKLGFSTVFVYGEPPFYAQVQRDRGVLNLKHIDEPVIDPALRDRQILLSADCGLDSRDDTDRLMTGRGALRVTTGVAQSRG